MSTHATVEHLRSISIRQLHRAGALREPLVSFLMVSFMWPGLTQLTVNRWRADVEFRGGASQRITITWTPCRFGNGRPWFFCPGCNRRVERLFNTGASLSCRECLDLRYASQRRGAKSRRYLQALKLRLRLNGIASLAAPFPERPKRMHRKTYLRLRQRAERLERGIGDSSRFKLRETDYSVLVPK